MFLVVYSINCVPCSVMARGLVESSADFLTTGMDEFSGLHDVDDNDKHW